MALEKSYIPYGTAWSTPFAKWQGSLAGLHPLKLAADTARRVLEQHGIEPRSLDGLVLGWTVPSPGCFYGAPWMAGMMGAEGITGPMVLQACATSARSLETAVHQVEAGERGMLLVVNADRCSNGPHLTWPDPYGPGGRPRAEDWVWDNFNKDPFARNAMVETAENVAREAGIDRAAQDEAALLRYQQYQKALEDDRAFQKRYMVPVDVNPTGRKVLGVVEADEGVFATTQEGLARLRPVMPDGTVTFGSQTHPADGNAGAVVTTKDRARELSRDSGVTVRVRAFGEARARKGYMAMAVLPAAQQALKRAGWKAGEVTIKTHNPFAVNDVYLARELDVPLESFNNYGSSLVYGHPQAPTGMRLMAELIEELVLAGGGRGLFVGCAAGDSAAAVCLEVGC